MWEGAPTTYRVCKGSLVCHGELLAINYANFRSRSHDAVIRVYF
jgi:hypothetical protein